MNKVGEEKEVGELSGEASVFFGLFPSLVPPVVMVVVSLILFLLHHSPSYQPLLFSPPCFPLFCSPFAHPPCSSPLSLPFLCLCLPFLLSLPLSSLPPSPWPPLPWLPSPCSLWRHLLFPHPPCSLSPSLPSPWLLPP